MAISISDTDRRYLAVRLPNWVGDVIMALPTLLQLQRCGFVLRAFGQGWAKDLLAGWNVPVTAVPKGVLAASQKLRTIKIKHGLLFTNSLSSALSMRLAGIRAVGYRAHSRGLLLHAGLEKLPGRHEVEYFWRLGEAADDCWGAPDTTWPATPPRQIHLPLSNGHWAAAAKALALAGISCPYTVCCPMATSTTQGQSKRWPLFDEFCRALSAMGRTILICPGPGEEPDCEKFLEHAVVLPGLSLGAYAALLAGAELVVANDTGPMHIAAAVGVPVHGIFGNSNPLRTHPWGGQFVGGIDGWPDLHTVLSACEQSLQIGRRLQLAG